MVISYELRKLFPYVPEIHCIVVIFLIFAPNRVIYVKLKTVHLLSKFIREKIRELKVKVSGWFIFINRGDMGLLGLSGWISKSILKQQTFEATLIHFSKINVFKSNSTKVTYKWTRTIAVNMWLQINMLTLVFLYICTFNWTNLSQP